MTSTSARVLRWGLLVAALAAGGVAYTRYSRASGAGPVSFETATVDRGRIVAKVTASGTVSALVTVQIGSQVSGRIKELLVDFNSEVRKGQILARIDPQLFEAALEQARANHLAEQGDLAAAQAQATNAALQLTRTQVLAATKLVAASDLDVARANADSTQAQVQAARARLAQQSAFLHQAEINLAYTTIRSPINGIVVSRNVDVGQTVAASLQAPTLFVVAEDLRHMQVDTSVAEGDIGKLSPGMSATFRVDAYPSKEFRGRVRQIRNAPQVLQNVVTYDAVIDVDNSELLLKPGMTANATFIYAEQDDVLRIPNAVLRFRPSPEILARLGKAPLRKTETERRDLRSVWRVSGNAASAVRIGIGITDGTFTAVTQGELKPGDKLAKDAALAGAASRSLPATGGGSGGTRRLF